MKQRIKCLFGFHDWRLHDMTRQPVRLLWRCKRCALDRWTPQTKRDQALVDWLFAGVADSTQEQP